MNLKADEKSIPVEDKLKSLYNLQKVVSQIDVINRLRGELPLEVQDLEDECAGLETRIANLQDDIATFDTGISNMKIKIKGSKEQIDTYKGQQDEVRNNREFNSIVKEIEFQELEIELAEKNIKEFKSKIENKNVSIEKAKADLSHRSLDLVDKKKELSEIEAETSSDIDENNAKIAILETEIEDRLLKAFYRIRSNANNGLALVTVQRDACGGCFNKIPPQRHLDIATHKKVIVCEYCGRILIDEAIDE